ncbi:hypothetical protein K9O30_21245 [Clostridium bowmanii]|uniref:hypothetical protein n=1 Tax=Clostridium bowmanii TaxID=132925 RepID=UPI001C0DE600|nr:hypothetical protein [Clostridium bowmanii]MBU3191902.1 hypothetical protein [Clostridium bowmanii]MCA1076201.1 hypothetical protein [Clostridium bowmanii]
MIPGFYLVFNLWISREKGAIFVGNFIMIQKKERGCEERWEEGLEGGGVLGIFIRRDDR